MTTIDDIEREAAERRAVAAVAQGKAIAAAARADGCFVNWRNVPWSKFVRSVQEPSVLYTAGDAEAPAETWINSRYQVSVWYDGAPSFPVWGEWAHLSVKTHDRGAWHDWRDLQRIKNEIVGPEHDAVEIYPAESKLVDTANQYHLFVFRTLRLPIGYQERLVGDGSASKYCPNFEQRKWSDSERPADCLTGADIDARIEALLQRKGGA